MLNVFTCTGNLGADPEVKVTSTGKESVKINVYCSRNYPDRNGQYLTDLIPCVAWDKTGAFICRHFRKGDFISLVGELRPFTITENGKTYKSFSINITSVAFGGGKQNLSSLPSSDTNTAEGTTTKETDVFKEFDVSEFDVVEEELPF